LRNWRIDFTTLWIVQFVAAAGFTVAGPFVPLYIQQLGVHGVREAAVWSGLMGAMGGIALAVTSPMWGMIADRRGRKLMVERATIGASVFQAAMGLVSNVQELVLLRGLQSMVSGVQAAVMALAATIIPQARLGFAMGTLQTATALGSTIGPVVGGVLAAAFGYRPTFFLTGIILFLSGVLCWVAVHEQFTPPAAGAVQQRAMAGFKDVLKSPGMGGLLLVMALSRAASQAMAIAIPLILQEMAGGSLDVSGITGTVIGLTALGMAAGATFWGRLGDHVGQPRILVVCLVLSALLIIPQTYVQQPWQLAVGQVAYSFTLAGLLPASSALIGIIGPRGRHGVVYGASGTALAMGNALGPTLAALLIGALGTRAMFAGVGVILFALHLTLRRMLGPAYRARWTE
jgi:MFS transporter, DHA1 family, multidrug resistance protein